MLINRTIKAGHTDPQDITGRYVSLLRAEVGTRLRLSLQGRLIFNSEMVQGMSLSEIDFDKVEIYSETNQMVQVWISSIKFNAEPERSARPQTIKGYRKAIGAHVNPLLPLDMARTLAKITSDKDMYIGGDNLEVVNGTVLNGAFYPAGKEISITPYGEVYCYWSSEVGKVFDVPNDSPIKYVPWAYPPDYTARTSTELLTAGLTYFDVLVPDEMHNVPMDFTIDWGGLPSQVGNGSYTPSMYITTGDPSTEETYMWPWNSLNGDAENSYVWSRNVSLTKGLHRIFIGCRDTTAGAVALGDETAVKMHSLRSNSVELSPAAILNILEERL